MSAPYGFCQCGCGQQTPIATYTYAPRDIVKGEPTSFCQGHRTSSHYGGLLPADPFRDWLNRRLNLGDNLDIVADRAGMCESRRLRAVLAGQKHVALDTVDRVLTAHGDHLDVLYPYQEVAA